MVASYLVETGEGIQNQAPNQTAQKQTYQSTMVEGHQTLCPIKVGFPLESEYRPSR